jgi:hypothetical protein
MTEPRKRKGCFFYVLIIAAVMVVTLIIGGVLGIRYGKNLVDQFTESEPVLLPRVTLSRSAMDELRDRIERFGEAVEQGRSTEPLVLSADEVNALIVTDPVAAAFRNRLFVIMEGDQLTAQITIPADEIGLTSLRGRYINATGTFDIALKDGTLWVTAGSLSAKGGDMPETLMRQLRGQNLASRINSDPRSSRGVAQLDDIHIKDGRLVLVPRRRDP